MRVKQISGKIPWRLAAVYALITACIAAGGWLLYRQQAGSIKRDVQNDLAVIADMKSNEIGHWLRERMGDAEVLAKSPLLARNVGRWLDDPANTAAGDDTRTRIEALLAYDAYQTIILADLRGSVRMAAGRNHVQLLGTGTRDYLLTAVRSGQTVFSDFYRCDTDNEVHLDIFAPLRDGRRVTAVVILRIDPDRFLFPLIQSWPLPRKSSETLVVRREGDSVLFLNDLRFAKDAAMKLRRPLRDTLLPSAMAALGKEGMVEGRDYRGVNVLASVKRIPDSPWYMVAKIDSDEVYRPVRRAALMIGASCLLLMLLAGTMIGLVWQRRQRDLYQRLRDVELERKALVGHFDHIAKYANDIIFLADDKNRLIEANDRALQAYGRSRDELLGKTADILRSPSAKPLFKGQMDQLRSNGSLFYETLHQRKDGTEFPVEISARLIMIEGKGYLQGIVRDITERKQAQAEIAARNRSLELLHQCSLDLASLPEGRSLPEALTDWLKKLSGGYAVTFGEYDRDTKEIAIKRILLEPEALARIETAIGKRLMDVRSPVSPETCRLMMAEQVGVRGTLHEITFGAVPKLVSATVGVMLGIEKYVALVYQTEGTMYATSVIALEKGQPEPDHAALKAFGALGAVSLRRAQAEEKLQAAHEELQASYEEIEANNQQLAANNEELVAADEELKQKNEELQAAEEELRKQNEELTASEEELKANEEELEQQLGEIEKGREELSASELRYRRLFETAQECILILNAETGHIEDANPYIKDMLGYRSEELIGKELWEIGLFKDIVASRDGFSELRDKGRVRYEGLPLQTKDGLVKQIEFYTDVYNVGDHKVVQCNIRDITARKRAEESLRRSEEENRAIVNAVPDILFRVDATGTILDYRADEKAALYIPPEAFMGKNIADVLPADVSEKIKAAMSEIREGSELSLIEYSLEMAEGGRHFECRMVPLAGGQLLAVVRDITARKRADVALLALTARQEALLDAIPEIVMEVDADKTYTWANQAGLQFFGEDVIGKKASHYFVGEQATYETVKPIFDGSKDLVYVESWQRRKDGQKRLLAWWCRILRNGRVEVTGALSTAQDITDWRQNEEMITRQLAELQRWHGAMLDREDRVRALKGEINGLLAATGKPPRYSLKADGPGDGHEGGRP